LDNPFEVVVYDKNMNPTGFVVDPIYANFVPSWDNQGYGNFMLTADNPHTEALQADGARITMRYRGKLELSGPIRSWQGDVLDNGTITYQVLDDRCHLENTILFVNPDNPLQARSLSDLAQAWPEGPLTVGTVSNQDGYFYWPDSLLTPAPVPPPENDEYEYADQNLSYEVTAETAIKYVIAEQLGKRLGYPLNILPNQLRGGDVSDVLPRVRFPPLSEVMTPLTKKSGLSVRIWQDEYGKALNVDVVEPGVWEQPLTSESGIIVSGSYQIRRPEVTRAIVGGNGDVAARALYGIEGPGWVTDDEKRQGQIIEKFRDATSGDLNWPDDLAEQYRVPKYYRYRVSDLEWKKYLRYLQTAEQSGLDEGSARSTLSLRLAETDTFHYGGDDGIQLGDKVTVVVRGVEFTDVVTEAQLTFTRENGLKVEPIIGQFEDDPDRMLLENVAAISRALRRLSSSK
jgi:hypothetical protein